MHAESSTRWLRLLTILIPVLALTGCGEGDGQARILGTAATPVPPAPAGQSCDFLNFEDFCPPALESIVEFEGGPISIVGNPQVDTDNDSATVGQMQKFAADSGATFGGSTMNLNTPFTVIAGSSFTMKVWSSRPVRILFQPEPAGPGSGVEETHGGTGWEVLTFNFGSLAGTVSGITLIFDNGVLGSAGTDPGNWTFYFDDITLVPPGGATGSSPIDPDVALYLTDGDPDLVAGDDYAERTPFGSGSVIDAFYAEDGTYSPVLSVFSGTGYGANIGQVGYIGFPAGFAGAYETLNFKVKGMPNFVIFVKLFDGVDTLRINLTSSAFSEELADGWYQVSIPVSSFVGVDVATGLVFESDNSASMQFTFLLTDIGFSGTGTGGPVVADPGTIPDDVIYASAPGEAVDLVFGVDYTGFEPFTSGTTFDNNVTSDADFSPAFGVTTGDGYGAQIGQFAIVGFDAGFAAGYATLDFKVKGMNENLIRVKLLNDPNPDYVDIVLTSSSFATALGNEWYQVSVPITAFAGDVATATGLLFETGGTPPAVAYTFLLTDFGFSGTAGGDGGAGIIPDDVIYASAPGETVDLVFGVDYTGFEPFTSGTTFDNNVTTDADFNPAFGVTTGDGYGAQIGQFAIVGFDAGFAAGYATLDFKIKGMNEDLIRVKLLNDPNPDYLDIVLTSSGFSTALGNGWYQVSVPITAFAGDVATAAGLLFETGGTPPAVAYTFLLTDFGFSGTAGGSGGGDIAVNGGFETGDFSGWDLFPGGGLQSIVTDNPSAGTYAANLNVPVRTQTDPGVDNFIKNANLEAGNLTAGATVTVTFDMRGSLSGAGGVVFVELFSELSGGGASKSEILGGGPIFPDAAWTPYSFTTTLGPDVSGGVTLQLKTSCGPVEGCGVDAYFDNVSIVIGGTGGGDTGGTGSCGGAGELAINCGFETGAFNDGTENASWQQFPGGGTQTIITDNPSSGTYAANLIVPVRSQTDPAVDNLIKNANLGAGTISSNASITVSFDMRGSLSGAGGVVFAELFSELSGGGTSKSELLSGGALAPNAAWTNYSYTTTLGADVSGGVTLQLKTSCGPVEGCGVDAYFDNVSIVLN